MKKHHIEYVEVVGVDGGFLLLFLSLCITKCSRLLYSGGKKNIKKLMINGEFVIEWKKEKSTPIVLTVGEHGCGSHSCH